MKRNGEIDALRFVFAFMILLHHFSQTLLYAISPFGSIGVEFFFIVTGYFMARHVEALRRRENRQTQSIPDDTWHFILGKIRVFYKYYIVAIIWQIVVRGFIFGRSLSSVLTHTLKSIPTLTLTFCGLNNNVGFYVGNTWYLSAMIIACFFLYPILLKNYEAAIKLIFPALALLMIGYLVGNHSTLIIWDERAGFLRAGILRAMGDIALGCSLCPLVDWLKKQFADLPEKGRGRVGVVLTVVKYLCYAVLVGFALNCIPGMQLDTSFSMHALFFCVIGVVLTFSQVGWYIPDSALTRTLGKMSLVMYVFHGVLRRTLGDYGIRSASATEYWVIIVFAIALCVDLGFLTDLLADRLGRVVHLKSRVKTGT